MEIRSGRLKKETSNIFKMIGSISIGERVKHLKNKTIIVKSTNISMFTG